MSAAAPSPLAGEGGFAKRSRVRGLSPHEQSCQWKEPLIRRFAPPSPTRGDGRRPHPFSFSACQCR
ncbi:hypothetical protein E4K66_16745 [Bradyrhizobium frederickii]|uniref:Uncharacterized protein n=1 Tax=Bradyrhizobium frederickii TaxID=2560054 RepID=A0A4Y9L3B4_9BRAD|nr:hypothetical protein E4K66_16745 [Bradyrhizobium frederickii]